MPDSLEFLSMVHELHAQIDSVVVNIDNRLVLSTQGESVEMAPATLLAIKELLGLQNRVIQRLLEESESAKDAVERIVRNIADEREPDGSA
jgi:hypothetical protein